MVHLGKLESLNGLVENGSRPHAARVDLCGSEGPVNGSSCVPWTLRAASIFLRGHVLLASSSFLSAVQCHVNRPFQVSAVPRSALPAPFLLTASSVGLWRRCHLQFFLRKARPPSCPRTSLTLFMFFRSPSLLLPASTFSPSPWPSSLPGLVTKLFPPLQDQFLRHSRHLLEHFL